MTTSLTYYFHDVKHSVNAMLVDDRRWLVLHSVLVGDSMSLVLIANLPKTLF